MTCYDCKDLKIKIHKFPPGVRRCYCGDRIVLVPDSKHEYRRSMVRKKSPMPVDPEELILDEVLKEGASDDDADPTPESV